MVDDSIVVSLNDIQVDERLNYMERSVAILDRMTKTIHSGFGEGEMAALEGFRVDLGTRG